MKALLKSVAGISVLLALCSIARANDNQPGRWDTLFLIAPAINVAGQPYVTGWKALNTGTKDGYYSCYVTFTYDDEESYDSMGGSVNGGEELAPGYDGVISDDNPGGSGPDIYDYDAPTGWSTVSISIILQSSKGSEIDCYSCTMNSAGVVTSGWTESPGAPWSP